MKKARMNISHSRFIFFNLKIFDGIVTTIIILHVIYNIYQHNKHIDIIMLHVIYISA